MANLPSHAVATGLEPAVAFEFETQGVLRTFSLYTTPAEHFNFTRVFLCTQINGPKRITLSFKTINLCLNLIRRRHSFSIRIQVF